MVTMIPTQDATDLIFDLNYVCPRCGHFTQWFRNVGGRTFCVQCVPRNSSYKEELCRQISK
jgi:hypothetical protein